MDFRLIDFHIYDENTADSGSASGSGSDSENASRPIKKDLHFVIQMFGINEAGETVSIFVDDYQPFFYCKLPDSADQTYVTGLLKYVKENKEMSYYKDDIVSAKLVQHNKLYGFTGGKKSKFAKFVFKNTVAMRKMKNLWFKYEDGDRRSVPFRYKTAILTLYESNIPPLLRYFHIQNISPSGWVSLDKKSVMEPPQKTTTCTYEYICSCDSVRSLPEKETLVPYKICSFDIEASSSHGDFPVPVKSYKRLASNLVDFFIKQKVLVQSEAQYAKMLATCISNAFGIGKTFSSDIDLVYPIGGVPPGDKFKKQIKEFGAKEFDASNTEVKGEMTIESMFEQKIREQEESRGGEDGDEDISEDAAVGGERDEPIGQSKGKFAKKVAEKGKISVLQLLLGDLSRDEKVVFITNAFRESGFPKLEGDKVTFIGSTFMRYGDVEPYLNHCVVLGSCDPVEGAVIETVDEEVDLLMRWTQVIQKENPDIIIGYNIFGFDYEFMFRRAEENGCTMDFLMLSRRQGELCANETVTRDGTKIEIEHTKAVFASGEFDLRYFKMSGRLQIDMYSYFRRDFNLSSYKLDDVAGMFISDDISHIEYSLLAEGERSTTDILGSGSGSASASASASDERTYLFSKNLMGLHVGDYIHIEITKFTSDYYQDGKKFVVLDIIRGVERPDKKGKLVSYNVIVIEGRHEIDENSIKWTMAKDDVTPQDIFRLTKDGGPEGRARVAKYCIQDCNLVHHLMNKIDVMTGYVEMSRICSVPISFLVFRGQGIKLTSYVAKKCRDKDTLMPDLEKSRGNEGYEGAIVLPPKCKMYIDEPVACVDYSSLYPSSMISQNYSHDSKVWAREYNLAGEMIRETGERGSDGKFLYDNLPGYEYIDVEFDTFEYRRKSATSAAVKTKVGKMIVRWAQLPGGQKSIMPSILEELLKARSDTRKLAKTVTDPFMENILDKRQLGYKVTANSLYGQCGSKTSTFYEKDVAACTTATGRMMITYARRIVEEVYGDRLYETKNGQVKCSAEYVYGDTDSVFFTFNLEDPKTKEKIRGKPALEATIEIAQDVANLCTSFLKPPMALAYEKTLMPFILLSKKRYVGMLYEEDPNKGKLKFMGLSLKRRDACDYLKDTYGGILNILMAPSSNTIQSATDFLKASLRNLIDGKVPMDKLAITKALRSDYKNPQSIAHRVLADRIGQRDPGNKPKPGDRIKYLFVTNPDKKALLGERVETPEFILGNKIKIDYMYYITNQLMKPLQQLFGLAVDQILEQDPKKHKGTLSQYIKDIDAMKVETTSPEGEWDIESYMKKKEKYCSAKIKTLLFEEFLQSINNKTNRVRTVEDMYKIKR